MILCVWSGPIDADVDTIIGVTECVSNILRAMGARIAISVGVTIAKPGLAAMTGGAKIVNICS
jgi:hypothetical protein